MANNVFPNPPNPYSLREIVAKMLDDQTGKYAQFIHDQVSKARAGDATAKKTVDAHFNPTAAELTALNVSQTNQPQYALCTDPKTRLLPAGDVPAIA
jgi:hypothetical protein